MRLIIINNHFAMLFFTIIIICKPCRLLNGHKLIPYSEKTADVRIAQYEKNARTPNAETTAKLAEVLKVSPVVFSPTICASREDLLQSMYWLFLMKGGGDIYDCETEYARSRMEQKLGVITVEEFLEKILVN